MADFCTAALTRPVPYNEKLDSLLGHVGGKSESHTPEAYVARPLSSHLPSPWVLGSSGSTARIAAHHGAGFTFAHFINPTGAGARAAQEYRSEFKRSRFFDDPEVIVTVFLAVAEEETLAADLTKAFHIWLANIETGDDSAKLPKLDYARRHEFTSLQRTRVVQNHERIVSGTPFQAIEKLKQIAAQYETDQIMVNPYIPGIGARTRAIELLAAANV